MAYILIIDDDDGLRSAIARLLARNGHDVDVAPNGREAMRAIAGRIPELVITDINMPEMDGIEVIIELRESRPRLPVIAMSGGGRVPKEMLLDSADLLGATRQLEKPFEMEALLEAVDAALK